MWPQANTAGSEVFLRTGVILFIGKILNVENHLNIFCIVAGPKVNQAIVRTQ